MGEGTEPVFFGRGRELALLTRAMDDTEASRGSFQVIAGEAGLGKSSLVRKVMDDARGRGWTVLAGECFLGEENVPYFPITRAIRGYLEGPGEVDRDVPQMAMGLMALDKDDDRSTSQAQFNVERDKLFQGVLEFLTNTSRAAPVLLFVDDLQWADRATLQLLLYLTHSMKKTRTLFLGAYRPEEVKGTEGRHPYAEFESRLVYEGLAKVTELSHLGLEDSSKLAASVVGHEVPADIVNRIHSLAAGNPFFIKEFCGAMRQHELDTGHPTDGHVAALDGIPSTVAEVIAARTRRLDQDARTVLETGSVLGQEFSYDVLLAAAGLPEPRLVETLDRLFAAGMLEEAEVGEKVTYHFNHSLMREVTYNHLSRARRRYLHKRVGEHIEETYAGQTEQAAFSLAYHFLRTSEFSKALDYHILAGRVAMREHALEDARGYFETALDIILKHEEVGEAQWKEVEVLTSLGRVHSLIGSWKRALELFSEALTLSTEGSPEWALVHRYMGEVKMERSEFPPALDHFTKALEVYEKFGDTRGLAETYRCLAWVTGEQGRLDESLEYANKVIASAEKLGDTNLMGKSLIDIGNGFTSRDEFRKAIGYYKKALDRLDRKKDFDQVARAYNNIGNAYTKLDMDRKAIEYFQAVLDMPQAQVLPVVRAYILGNLGECNYKLGRTDKAQKYLEEAIKLQKMVGNRSVVGSLLSLEAQMAYDRKEIDRMEALFAEAFEVTRDASVPNVAGVHRDYGLLKKELGHAEAAREHLEKALALYEKMGGTVNMEKIRKALGQLGPPAASKAPKGPK